MENITQSKHYARKLKLKILRKYFETESFCFRFLIYKTQSGEHFGLKIILTEEAWNPLIKSGLRP